MTRLPRTRERPCRDCDLPIIFATRDGRRVPYDADARTGFTDAAMGCHVLVANQAMTPGDAIEHFRTRFEITETKARDLVSGYPFHRPHYHPKDVT